MGALQSEAVEDIDDNSGAVVESEWRRELLATSVAGRVDEDDLVRCAEVVGLCQPHVTGHEQARPEHHGLTGSASPNPHLTERGVDRLVLHCVHGSPRS